MMKRVAGLLIVTLASGVPCAAQEAQPPQTGVMLGGVASCGTPEEHCLDVHGQPYRQLNDELKRKVDQTNPPALPSAPLDATSQDIHIGVVNIPAVKQQYGKNFGVSVYPYRPPPLTYGNPVHTGR